MPATPRSSPGAFGRCGRASGDGGKIGSAGRVGPRDLEFPTDDPVSLLAGTLIHECVHTPERGGSDPVSGAVGEGKDYAVEVFFSERMGDTNRPRAIHDKNWDTNAVWTGSGANKIFHRTYTAMTALYEVIDQGGAPAVAARALAVEFMRTNPLTTARSSRSSSERCPDAPEREHAPPAKHTARRGSGLPASLMVTSCGRDRHKPARARHRRRTTARRL